MELRMVDQLARNWGVTDLHPGKTEWALAAVDLSAATPPGGETSQSRSSD